MNLTRCGTPQYSGETPVQLTHSKQGHTLHHNGVFSKDGQWVVFDGRNDDTRIGETSVIGIVNLYTGEEKIIYQTAHPTPYGPGVGAASFSPVTDRVVFIHGLADADKEKPYNPSRRTGVAIDLERPLLPLFMDARDITAPYTPGALRGGTHSHCWSGDGSMISFTYNDELVDPDLRTIGVMLDTGRPVLVDSVAGNNSGRCYAAVAATVVRDPRPGSDEISKAFDECWVGNSGYRNNKGQKVPHAIAFQGNTKNEKGQTITEIFIADLDPAAILNDATAVGRRGERPRVPKGISVRRVSRSIKGLSSVRHWLRSSPDGRYIYALAPDEKGISQLIRCTVNNGAITYLTSNPLPIDYSFNLDHTGTQVAYVSGNNIYIQDLEHHKTRQLTFSHPGDQKIVGAPSFAPDNSRMLFNQYQPSQDGEFLQIMQVQLTQ
ncbi:DUF3748 domain-containing protein [Niabella beijingensis]|uniref:DUF3748 domain-containing protein n=1 Tax=Niabella beijingensis TaxID=2872700 RepID=UPI001CC0AB0A|nr:DUF3748 domain-containing protein [Niabella beijingensis]MBZ4191941.1 DUF3748 domain-containing protein [Niabella beijingensis]